MRIRKFNGDSGEGEKTVLDVFRETGTGFHAECAGRGRCGKCLVRFLTKAPELSREEVEIIPPQKREEGWRLACKARPSGSFTVEYDAADEELKALGMGAANHNEAGFPASGKVAAVDLGTTTIAAVLMDRKRKEPVQSAVCVNHQRVYGADVISRIQAAVEGKGAQLKQLVQKDLEELLRSFGEDPDGIDVVVAGNTTMQHLLQGLPCDTLGVAPFDPVDISLRRYGNYLMLPGISTYVGADITAGIVASGMDQSEEISVLIDLGTNAEIAVGSREKILVASAAAGPAFEGGNITCGVAGIPGAICSMKIIGSRAEYETIGKEKPVGLCGTGVLETMYELLHSGIVDETGLMNEKYADRGFPVAEGIVFTGSDVREVQLAKAAVRAGLETLLEAYGISCSQVSRWFLAGGFGQHVNLHKAAGIGLIPPEMTGKAAALGNSSLKGAAMAACDETILARLGRTVERSREISLSGSRRFQELYVDFMMFEESE